MMGKDVENILSKVDKVVPMLTGIIESLADMIAPRDSISSENPQPYIFTNVQSYWQSIKKDLDGFASVKGKMMNGSTSFFNSIESPFKEYDRMIEEWDKLQVYIRAHSDLRWYAEKNAFIPYLNNFIFAINNFKIALCMYNDYIQRGYDTVLNGNVASITIKRSKNNRTNGNLDQKSNNASAKKKSIDPY